MSNTITSAHIHHWYLPVGRRPSAVVAAAADKGSRHPQLSSEAALQTNTDALGCQTL